MTKKQMYTPVSYRTVTWNYKGEDYFCEFSLNNAGFNIKTNIFDKNHNRIFGQQGDILEEAFALHLMNKACR
jgi:hypothetical protein